MFMSAFRRYGLCLLFTIGILMASDSRSAGYRGGGCALAWLAITSWRSASEQEGGR